MYILLYIINTIYIVFVVYLARGCSLLLLLIIIVIISYHNYHYYNNNNDTNKLEIRLNINVVSLNI